MDDRLINGTFGHQLVADQHVASRRAGVERMARNRHDLTPEIKRKVFGENAARILEDSAHNRVSAAAERFNGR